MRLPFIVKYSLLAILISTTTIVTSQNPSCPNFNFSQRNFTNWICQTYIPPYQSYQGSPAYSDLTYTDTIPLFFKHTIITDSVGYDTRTYSISGQQLKLVPYGFNQCAMVGRDFSNGLESTTIMYPMTVDSSNALLLLHFAIVLEDPGHPPYYQPRFEIRIQDSNRNLINGIYNNYLAVSANGIPGFNYWNYDTWKDWTTLGIDLTPIIGQRIFVVCAASGCGYAGHFGYGYFIGECRRIGIDVFYCGGNDTAHLQAPGGFISYVWRDSANSIVGNNQVLHVPHSSSNTIYSCLLTNALGDTSLLGCLVKSNILSSEIVCDSLSKRCYPSRVNLSHNTTLYSDSISSFHWDIIKMSGGLVTEYYSLDSAFDYTFQDTGYYKIIFSVYTQNGCSAYDTIMVYSYPNTGEYINAGFTDSIQEGNCVVQIYTQDTSQSSGHSHNIWNVYNESDSSLVYTCNDSNLHYIFQDTGLYRVELIAFSTMGCSDTLSHLIPIDSLIIETTFYDTACFSYTWNDSTYYQSGTYHQRFRINTCDSLVSLHLTVFPTHSHVDTISICVDELPYLFEDSLFTKAGLHNIYYTNIFGCDSIMSLFLIVNHTYNHADTLTICINQLPYQYGDSILYAAGNYQIHFTSYAGCDSCISLTLSVNPTYNDTDSLTLCNNELPYVYGDSMITAFGDYTVVMHSLQGCDSIIQLNVIVNTKPPTPLKIYGDTIIFIAGTYTYYTDTVNHADSYQWSISNLSWSGSSFTDTIHIYIPSAGTGSVAVRAINSCGLSDSAAIYVSSSVAITNIHTDSWTLGQNIPNPAHNSIIIPFSVPNEANVYFTLTTVNGQLLYSQEIPASAGNNIVEFDISTLPNGIYFYSMTFNGQQKVRKMVVQ
ncbi:MAG: T9SS type A sorting domain-containing protein [Bacteroidales bacterium]|nr:T9SS type A sorting domain-containing protein [Bacteroidales bacterium]